MARKNTQEAINHLYDGKAYRAASGAIKVYTDGTVYSYGTCIAALETDGVHVKRVVLNTTRYSMTTTMQQNGLRWMLEDNPWLAPVEEVSGLPLGCSEYALLNA